LREALTSGDWGRYSGAAGDALRDRLAEMHAAEHVTLCCSGTIGVELALRGLGVTAGDEVLLAGYDFGGNFRAIEAVGATPVLVEVDPGNWNLDPGQLEDAWSPAVRAVIASHLHGGIVPMSEVVRFACRHEIQVVEDACQAPGAQVEGRIAGTWGDVGVLSFGGSKLLTAGRGGAVFTTRDDVHQRIKITCQRGNEAYPLSQLQAAVVTPQLERLAERNEIRLRAAERLNERLSGLAIFAPLENHVAESRSAFFKLGVKYLADRSSAASRGAGINARKAEGVAADAGFRGFVRRSQRRCRQAGELTQCRLAAENMIVLHHPVLLEPDEVIDRVGEAFEKVNRAFGDG